MGELEARESQLRSARKQAGERERERSGKRPALEAEVVHTEILGPADGVGHGPEPMVIDRPSKPNSGQMLTGMEAQLKAELKHWESLKQQEGKGGVLSKLFRRREP